MTAENVGRVCAICCQPGGSGLTQALRGLGYDVPQGQIGYAHGDCLIAARRRQERQKAKGLRK